MDYTEILSRFKIESLNDMQQAAMSAIPKPNDVIIISPTGSGKTLAFLLPALQLLKPDVEGVQLLIVVPSRELALQIEQVFKQMGTSYKINCCYGGHSIRIEKNNLSHPPAVLVEPVQHLAASTAHNFGVAVAHLIHPIDSADFRRIEIACHPVVLAAYA